MLVGAVVQIGTGMGLIAIRRLTGLDVIDEKMITKFALAVLVVLFATLAWRRQRLLPNVRPQIRPLLLGAELTAIANVVVAAVWV